MLTMLENNKEVFAKTEVMIIKRSVLNRKGSEII